MIQIAADRLSNAKRAFTTRNVDTSALCAISNDVAPRAGDVVLARVLEVGAHRRLELPTSRKALLFAGDEVVLAYGNRYAPDQFEAYVPDDLSECHLAAAGGIAGRVVNKNERMSDPTRIEPIGIFVDSEGMRVNVRDHALRATAPSKKVPGFAVVGGSMNAGKTTTAASLVRGLTLSGRKVGAAKLTGTGAGNDYWHMRDAGAAMVLDFTDAGMATTFKANRFDLEVAVNTLAGHLVEAGCDALVFEIADGLFQEETNWLVSSQFMHKHADGYLYAAEGAASAAMGVQWLKRHTRVLGVSGLVSASPLAARETETATGFPCFTKEALASPEVAHDLLDAVTERVVVQAA
jgi:hypothetical protein